MYKQKYTYNSAKKHWQGLETVGMGTLGTFGHGPGSLGHASLHLLELTSGADCIHHVEQ